MLDNSVARRIRQELEYGIPLDGSTRSWLENSFRVDLDQVRVHVDPRADELAKIFDAEAFTVGSDIFFRTGRYNLCNSEGRKLLAHEVSHAVRTGCVPHGASQGDRVQPFDDPDEYLADEFSVLALSGKVIPESAVAPRRLEESSPLLVKCHSSWEHRMLGDCNTESLDIVAKALDKKSGESGSYLKKLRQLLLLWETDPEKVTEGKIKNIFPDLRTVTLKNSGLIVTYGELNTLADYLPEPEILEEQPKEILLPILQTVRQETYNKIGGTWLLDESSKNFDNNIVNWQWGGFLEKLLETKRMNDLTMKVGEKGKDHYYGLLARNACHFAPFSWHRWYQYYTIARKYATDAYQGGEKRDLNTHKAWLYHGYADHFLQDSFAAGHLVNKTRVMQWFIEWSKDKYIPTGDWKYIKEMTLKDQANLAPDAMYTEWPYTGVVMDPESGQEKISKEERKAASGVEGSDTEQAYSNWLKFLANGVVQSSTAALHDHYNAQSLWVSSDSRKEPYQIWGDDTMLRSGDGVRIASDTARNQSQESILNILTSGEDGGISAASIRSHFPSRVGDTKDDLNDLKTWNEKLQNKANKELFGGFANRAKYLGVWTATPTLGKVSLDDSVGSNVIENEMNYDKERL
ncbi:eCIS core domain-containing protein [Streptomyces albireticuli]|uniref:eCIS core domain-containing protein n=1 Tax=Streptomyces albireticuli TaxID=1940 RepID=UPI0026993997|nr:DUF4157 domain-containing protein [Streptomyces albireticuli]